MPRPLAVLLGCLAACGPQGADEPIRVPEAISLAGDTLYRPPVGQAVAARYDSLLVVARAASERDR